MDESRGLRCGFGHSRKFVGLDAVQKQERELERLGDGDDGSRNLLGMGTFHRLQYSILS